MKTHPQLLLLLAICIGCARQPSLPRDSKYNVASNLNDSTWYGTGKILRFRKSAQTAKSPKTFNFLVYTDINYPGMSKGPNTDTENGCTDPECTRTQALLIYNIPLKKGKHSISKIDISGASKKEHSSFAYLGNSGGVTKLYRYKQEKPGWIRVNRIDKAAGIIEGSFTIWFREDDQYRDVAKQLPDSARFTDGLFRVKVTDIVER